MGQLILAALLGAIAGTMVMLQLGYSSLWSLLVGAPLGALTGFIGENPKAFFASLSNNTMRLANKTLSASGDILISIQGVARDALEEALFWIAFAGQMLLSILWFSSAVAIAVACSQLPYAWFAETPVFSLIGSPHLLDFSFVPSVMVLMASAFGIQDTLERKKRKQRIAKTIASHALLVVFLGIAAWPIVIGMVIARAPYFAFCIVRLTIIQVATHRNITVAGSIIEGLSLGWLMQQPALGITASVAFVVLHWSLRDWAERFKAKHWKSNPSPTPA